MKFSRKKTMLLGLVLCMAAQISGCGLSGNTGIAQREKTNPEPPETDVSEISLISEKELKSEQPEIISATSWSEADLSDFREVFYPGFELETAVIDGRSYRKFAADNGYYVIEKGKNADEEYIIEIGREGQSKEYPICNTIGKIGLETVLRVAYTGSGRETSVAPRIFWSDVTGDGQEDICIRIDGFDYENWLLGKTAICNLYIYDCANDNFITVAGDSLYETFKNAITLSDAAVSADCYVSLSVTESGEKRDFILEDKVLDGRVADGCWLAQDRQYIMVQDGQISMGYWIEVIVRPESNWDGMSGAILDGPLVYRTLEYNDENGCFEPAGEMQMEFVNGYKYANTEEPKSVYWENYIKEHREQ